MPEGVYCESDNCVHNNEGRCVLDEISISYDERCESYELRKEEDV